MPKRIGDGYNMKPSESYGSNANVVGTRLPKGGAPKGTKKGGRK